MRTIAPELTAAQQSPNFRIASPSLLLAGVDRSHNLAYFTYRERAFRSAQSRVLLNNSKGALTSLLSLGATVDLARGAIVDGTPYLAQLPRLWVNRYTLERQWYILECIDFWGKLARWNAPEDLTWTDAVIGDIIDDIFTRVGGLTRETPVTTTTPSYTLNTGVPGHVALRELMSRSGLTAYAGLNGNVKFKNLETDTTPVYTLGWRSGHPIRDVSYSPGVSRYNRVTVIGGLDAGTGLPIEETANDAQQQAWVGIRLLLIEEPMLTNTLLARHRAKQTLAMHMAMASRAQPVSLPIHGLEVLDLCTLATTPWGGENYLIRCAGYTEEFRPRHHYQKWFPYAYHVREYVEV